MINGTGWTWAEVRAMKIGDWRRLTDHWAKHPPACELLELQVRGAQRGPAAREPTEADMRALQSMVEGP